MVRRGMEFKQKNEIVEKTRQLLQALLIMVQSPELKIAKTKMKKLFPINELNLYIKKL